MRKSKKLIGLMMALVILSSIAIWHWQPNQDDLSVKLAAITGVKLHEKEGILLVFDYDWSAAGVVPFADELIVEWSRGWKISGSSLQTLRTQKFVKQVKAKSNHLRIKLNTHIFHDDHEQGEIFLTPLDLTHLNKTVHSAANIQYEHRSFLGRKFAASSSTGWNNALILQAAAMH